MTERIYEQDSYCRSFTAKVLECIPAGEHYRVVLDRTAFFPEGGGQAADQGTLGGVAVLDVQREGNVIYHTVASPIESGSEVEGLLDWELRYSRMQSHTGEHILSGVIYSLFGYHNQGFHMAESLMTVDTSGPLTQADIDKIELEANRAVYQNAEITAFFPSAEEQATLQYRSKLEDIEELRIVRIGKIDCCACCAPHLARSGEVGLIKILNFYPNKQGTRIEMLAGIHALKDYCALNAANRALMKLLSAPRDGVLAAVQGQNEALHSLRGEKGLLARRLALYELQKVSFGRALYALAGELSFDELRYCANSLMEKECDTCVLLAKGEESYLYVVASRTLDARQISSRLNEAFEGKGGGKENYVQGRLRLSSEQALRACIEKLLK